MTSKKQQRDIQEKLILIGLIDLYVITGEPIGSKTLKEKGFNHFSSATIRNYFIRLEKDGFLRQKHTSGGRVPTASAYKYYAKHHIHATMVDPQHVQTLKKGLIKETSEIVNYLQDAAELLSHLTKSAVFLSSPRFDKDLILSVKLMAIDKRRYLCVLVTDFGLIHTEVLHSPKKLSNFTLKRIEKYFHFRMTGLEKPALHIHEESVASDFYNEILLRHVVDYSNFSAEDIYKTGFSKLLQFPEFQDAAVLATGLSLFEDMFYTRHLLKECTDSARLRFWIGEDLVRGNAHTSVIAIPYFIHGKSVGSIALLGPTRMSYPKIFGIMKTFSALLSETLTRNLHKYKITYRQPQTHAIDIKTKDLIYLTQAQHLLLEDQS